MYITPTLPNPKKLIVTAALCMISALLAVAGPMSSVSQAQAAIDTSKFNTLKQKVLDELNSRIEEYKATSQSLNVDVSLSKEGAAFESSTNNSSTSASVNKDGASVSANSSSISLTQDGLNATIALPEGLKDKVQSFLEELLDGLTGLVEEVTDLTSGSTSSEGTALEKLESIADNIDSQFGLDQLTQVQGAVTQAIESMTGVLDTLKSTASDLQGQLTALKGCFTGLKDGTTTAEGTVSTEDGANISCGEFNTSSEDVVANAESQLANVKTVMTAISSVLLSAVTLATSLVSQFTGLAGGLGGLDSISGLLSGNGLESLTGSAGSVTGMLSSFSAISSQLDIANGMSGNAQNLLGSLTGLINV